VIALAFEYRKRVELGTLAAVETEKSQDPRGGLLLFVGFVFAWLRLLSDASWWPTPRAQWD